MLNEDTKERMRDSMSQLEFARWKILMNKIDANEEKRMRLEEKLNELRRQSNEHYLEMQQLWSFVRKTKRPTKEAAGE